MGYSGEEMTWRGFRTIASTLLRELGCFIIADGLAGPGRFLGCMIGIRVFKDGMHWYGEGEFKAYMDGDTEHPTICGTGLEDYVGTAWGMGTHGLRVLLTGAAGPAAHVAKAVRDSATLSYETTATA